jgi:hypothetical protein
MRTRSAEVGKSGMTNAGPMATFYQLPLWLWGLLATVAVIFLQGSDAGKKVVRITFLVIRAILFMFKKWINSK